MRFPVLEVTAHSLLVPHGPVGTDSVRKGRAGLVRRPALLVGGPGMWRRYGDLPIPHSRVPSESLPSKQGARPLWAQGWGSRQMSRKACGGVSGAALDRGRSPGVESGKGIHQVSHYRASWAVVRRACCLSSTLSPCACAAHVPLEHYCSRTETCPQAASCEWLLLEWRGGGRFLT